MSWHIDAASRSAIHIGGFTVVFNTLGEPEKILAPKLLERRVLDGLIEQASAAYRLGRGWAPLSDLERAIASLPTRQDLSLREAADRMVKLIEASWWRRLFRRRSRNIVADLRHAVFLATEHGIFNSRRA